MPSLIGATPIAARARDYLLGANQWGSSFVVGYGQKAAKKPHHWAKLIGKRKPRGAVVGGPAPRADIAEQGFNVNGKFDSAAGGVPGPGGQLREQRAGTRLHRRIRCSCWPRSAPEPARFGRGSVSRFPCPLRGFPSHSIGSRAENDGKEAPSGRRQQEVRSPRVHALDTGACRGKREGDDVSRTGLRSTSQRGIGLLLALGVLASLLSTALAPSAAPAAGSKEVVFTVGTKQHVDNMNPYAGVMLSAYEVWNLQYNVLVNLSADDMSPIPEVATSWEHSAGRPHLDLPAPRRHQVVRRQAAHLPRTSHTRSTRTAKEEWANFSPVHSRTSASSRRRTPPRRHHDEGTGPALPSLPVYVLPKHVWEKYGPKKVGSFANRDPVTSGPFRLTAWDKSSSWR